MPWTAERYPLAMRHLAPQVRDKAVEIANAVLEREGDEGKAIRVGIAQAKRWAMRDPRQSEVTRRRRSPAWW